MSDTIYKPSTSTISYKTNSSSAQNEQIIPTKEFAVGIPIQFEGKQEVFLNPPQLQNYNNLFLNEINEINGETVPPLYFIAAQSNIIKFFLFPFLFFYLYQLVFFYSVDRVSFFKKKLNIRGKKYYFNKFLI